MIQLGTRWGFGATPPDRLSAEVKAAIATVEADLSVEAGVDALRDARWTLTWLEGRPTATLDRDRADGSPVVVTVDARGAVVAGIEPEEDDSW